MGALVEIKDEQLRELDRLAQASDRTRESIVEDALAHYLNERRRRDRNEAVRARSRVFGAWRERDVDGLRYQQELRNEW